MRGLALLAILVAAGCASTPSIDIAASPGQPNALDSICQVSLPEGDEQRVAVICPSEIRPGERQVQASLQQGYRLRLLPLRSPATPITGGGVGYAYFIVPDGEPIRFPPPMPLAAARGGYTANCATRFDLTPEGKPTNICVECAATGARREYEDAVRDALEQWVYPPDAPQRSNLRVEMPFEIRDPGKEPILAPPFPQTACPAGAN